MCGFDSQDLAGQRFVKNEPQALKVMEANPWLTVLCALKPC
jgi:hypothetical protein